MAASAVGGWVASAFIAKLVEKACSYAGDQYEYQRKDTKEKLRILERNLSSIQTVIHVAERVQAKNTAMGSWLGRIKDAACQAEDVLDLFDYRVQQAQVEDNGMINKVASAAAGSSSSPASTITTASTTTSSSSSSTVNQSVRLLKRFLLSDEDIDELISVVDKFVEIDSELQRFLEFVNIEDSKPEQVVQWRTTTSMPGSGNFFGRVNEENHLKKLLVQINEQSSQPYDVISVVGIGGVGKTALVQRLYNHRYVKHHFDLTVWLHVSDKFDVGRLTKEMAQSNLSIFADLNSISSLDQAQSILRDTLNGKRALIVLDDVWNVLRSQLENLFKPLQFVSNGSKVIVTTRSKNVANMNAPTEIMHLHGLEDEDYWGFFSQCAFGDANPSDFSQLKKIGREVVSKLAGSPLAAKTIGGSLKAELEEKHWSAICGRKLWQIEQKEDDIISVLRLSYEHLPDHLKQCFVYFALFPKKCHLRGDELIQMWRAHGFLNTQAPDEIAYRYINDLLQLSFIEKVPNQEDHYVVHDLLHDVAESVSNGEHFRIEDDFNVCIPRNVRHLYVNASNILCMSSEELKESKKNLRSLIISNAQEGFPCKRIASSNFNHILDQTLQDLRSLRVLVLHNPDGILPDKIDHLKHLRYLNIHESMSFTSVPKSLFKLYHLHGLSLQTHQDWIMEKALQEGLTRLTQLRYLKAPNKIISGIESIGRLRSLPELEEYNVDSNMKRNICQLGELNELRGKLTITNLQNVRCREEAHEAKLFDKKNLNKLTLRWNHLKQSITNSDHDGVFEGLRPNRNLRELCVIRYMGIKSPVWLSSEFLSNIHYIELLSCHHWETLPPLGSLPFLRILKIMHLKKLENIDSGFYGGAAEAFPSLEELLFEGMTQWKGWSGVENNQHAFSRLRDIRIKKCNELVGPLPLPPSFNAIKISVCDSTSEKLNSREPEDRADGNMSLGVQLSLDRLGFLFSYLQTSSLATVHMLDISSDYLEAFNTDQEEWLQQLTSVKEIRLTGCLKLTSLPSNMIHLTSLESLCMEECPKLESLPQIGLPLSLKKLSVIRCSKTFSQLCSEINLSSTNTIQQVIVREPIVGNAIKRRRTSSQ
ncbi:putative disease resistance protein RGA1 [Hordeum vulgare subsp. vulgare]|uniref:putative disease resistance protein RGA1 n=1 Tax=Hordeum vulgare subsp. vulgare TaxID=112509 RepID=UPI001D1A5894|nr:putative disease resistance protein RGA1 [Hordeum vulgare subsp. vulgare]